MYGCTVQIVQPAVEYEKNLNFERQYMDLILWTRNRNKSQQSFNFFAVGATFSFHGFFKFLVKVLHFLVIYAYLANWLL